MTGVTGINDGETSMAQAGPPPGWIDAGSPNAFVVAPAMLDGIEHRADVFFGVKRNQTGNSTHNLYEAMSAEQ
jgi:hypothetical protein